MYFHNYTPFSLVERIPCIMNTPLPNMGKARFLFMTVKLADLYTSSTFFLHCLLFQTCNKVFMPLLFQHVFFKLVSL